MAGEVAGEERGPLEGYVPLAPLDALAPGSGRAFELEGQEIGLFRLEGSVHAIDNRCPHQAAPLSEGQLEGPIIACALHGWRFDVRTGGPPAGGGDFPRVARFRTRVHRGWVLIDPTPLKQPPRSGEQPAP